MREVVANQVEIVHGLSQEGPMFGMGAKFAISSCHSPFSLQHPGPTALFFFSLAANFCFHENEPKRYPKVPPDFSHRTASACVISAPAANAHRPRTTASSRPNPPPRAAEQLANNSTVRPSQVEFRVLGDSRYVFGFDFARNLSFSVLFFSVK